MPDMPQQGGGGAPPQDAPQGGAPAGGDQPQGGGGGIAEVIVQIDSNLYKLTQAVGQNPKIGDDVKKGFQTSLDAFRQASQALVAAVSGGGDQGEPEGDEGGGSTTPEQAGQGGAVPMSHQAMRGK